MPNPIESILSRTNAVQVQRTGQQLQKLLEAARIDMTGLIALCNETSADANAINNMNDFMSADGVVGGSSYSFTAGAAAATITGAGFVEYILNGVRHFIALDTTITIEDNSGTTDIADGRFGAWRILIDALGAVTTQKASANQQDTSAEIAMLTLGSVAQTADTVCIGYVVLGDVGAAYNIGTTNLSALTTETYYMERAPRKQVSGLHTALGAATVASAGAATLAVGTINAQVSGVHVAEISADATDDLTDADTIATTETGGWLLVTDLAGTGTSTISSDGIPGVSALADTDLAGANTALDTLCDNLPSVFVVLARIVVVNASGGTFTAKTTNWDATSMTTTVTDATVGTWDRTATTGFDSQKITPPAIPAAATAADVTATFVA
ncbi:hypothetical protein KAR91_33685 [Candidatus Pacearchaeota archaeon]|nr:hypothetical protein [Candidatus Pacearchaeota archaeon]